MINMGLFRINNQDILAFRPQIDHNFTQVLNSDPVYESFYFKLKIRVPRTAIVRKSWYIRVKLKLICKVAIDFNLWPPVILDIS